MFARVIMTIAVLFGAGLFAKIYQPIGMLVGGRMAGNQFLPSDAAYLQFKYTMLGMDLIQMVVTAAVLIVLFLIWIGPAMNAFYDLNKKESL
jgi:ethanolamine transporter EutH